MGFVVAAAAWWCRVLRAVLGFVVHTYYAVVSSAGIKGSCSAYAVTSGDETAVVRNPRYGPGPLWDRTHPEILSPYELIRVIARDHPDTPLFGVRSYLSSPSPSLSSSSSSVTTGDGDSGSTSERRRGDEEESAGSPEPPTLPGGVDSAASASESAKVAASHENSGAGTTARGDFEWQTYREVFQRVKHLAAALKASGLKEGDTIGFYAPAREEFHLVHFACSMLRLIFVPVYDTISQNAAQFIVKHASIKLLFVCPEKLASAKELVQVLTDIAHSTPTVTSEESGGATVVNELTAADIAETAAILQDLRIIALDSRAPDSSLANALGTDGCIYHTTFTLFEKSGIPLVGDLSEPPPANPDDLSMIMYTSGTTGTPKGAMLSNCSCLAGSVGLYAKIPKIIFDSGVIFLSYLPLAHIFGVVLNTTAMRLGGQVGFFNGNVATLTEDVAKLRPTVFAGVPRVYQRIHDGIRDQIRHQPIINRIVFFLAFYWKYCWLALGFQSTPLADKLVFNKIKDKFGGRVHVMINAGAPVPGYVATFLRLCVTDIFLDGYGLTETAGLVSATEPDDNVQFGIGSTPYCTTEIKLISVPSMNYFVTDNPPRGELLARGRLCFKGYYNDPERTAQVLDADGWVHTGDVCSLTSSGRIKVFDRTKNLFKLSQGEYISPDEIENIIEKLPFVQNAFVYGSPEMIRPVAIIVPNQTVLKTWAKTHHGLEALSDDIEALCKSEAVYKQFQDIVFSACLSAQLPKFKCVRDLYIHPRPWEAHTEFLTPTLKLKRHVVTQYFTRELHVLSEKSK